MTKYSKSPLRGSGRLGRLRIKTCGDDREDVTADVGFAPQSGHARLADLGNAPLALSPADFGKLIAEETKKWAKVVKFSGAKAD